MKIKVFLLVKLIATIVLSSVTMSLLNHCGFVNICFFCLFFLQFGLEMLIFQTTNKSYQTEMHVYLLLINIFNIDMNIFYLFVILLGIMRYPVDVVLSDIWINIPIGDKIVYFVRISFIMYMLLLLAKQACSLIQGKIKQRNINNL